MLESAQLVSFDQIIEEEGLPFAGPCYRCLFPHPPAPENCSRCSEAGVLGPVPGVIGTLQAMEVIKIVTGQLFSGALPCLQAISCTTQQPLQTSKQHITLFNSTLPPLFWPKAVKAKPALSSSASLSCVENLQRPVKKWLVHMPEPHDLCRPWEASSQVRLMCMCMCRDWQCWLPASPAGRLSDRTILQCPNQRQATQLHCLWC